MPDKLGYPECVRRKPGMYIGGTDARGLHVCLFEVIANALCEFFAGRGTRIVVALHANGSVSITDDGGGICVDLNPDFGRPEIELALASLHFTRPPDHVPPHFGIAGVGTKCVNAVSEWMRVETVWKGRRYRIEFARGTVTESLAEVSERPNHPRGTVVCFKPDPQIFREPEFDRNRLSRRLEELAALHAGLEILLVDERRRILDYPLTAVFCFPRGLLDFLAVRLPESYRQVAAPVEIRGSVDGVVVDLGFCWTECPEFFIRSFVNGEPSPLGGVHVDGLRIGLCEAVKAIEGEAGVTEYSENEIASGLLSVVSIRMDDPKYWGSTKDQLINPEVRAAVLHLVREAVRDQEPVRDAIRRIAELLTFRRRYGNAWL